MKNGKGFLEPDKAGSFAFELTKLYKITSDRKYLDAAIKIANTIADCTSVGDADNSPLIYRVHAITGEKKNERTYRYTTHYTPSLRLFEVLTDLGEGNIQSYQSAHEKMKNWLKTYPLQNNVWGPFFEDVTKWSNTQMNAGKMALYIMDKRDEWSATWQADARSALDWIIQDLGNDTWSQWGVKVINEQTSFPMPGNSHTARQGALELMYHEFTGDNIWRENAIRQLSWATYMVDHDGKNKYPNVDIWLTDGYGDYVRHYLRAMGAAPVLAPDGQDHILRSTSIVKDVNYENGIVSYETFDNSSQEVLRITFQPNSVTAGGNLLSRLGSLDEFEQQEGYTFELQGEASGVLRVRHDNSGTVRISDSGTASDLPMKSIKLKQIRIKIAKSPKGNILKLFINRGNFNISIYDSKGTLLKKRDAFSNTGIETMLWNSFAPGNYMVVIEQGIFRFTKRFSVF